MKKFIILLGLLIALMPLSVLKTSAETAFVYDPDGYFSSDEADELEAKCESVSEEYDSGVYVAIVADMADYDYYDIDEFGEAFFEDNNLGLNSDQDGILLVLSMEDRDYSLTAHGEIANAAYTDYGKEQLEEVFLDNFGNDDWYGGALDYVNECESYLSQWSEGTPVDYVKQPFSLGKGLGFGIPIGIIAGLIAAFIRGWALKKQLKDVGYARDASYYVADAKADLRHTRDVFIRRAETRRHIERKKPGGGHGGTTVNHSGFSHRSGKF